MNLFPWRRHLLSVVSSLFLVAQASAGGIPEPGLTTYGVIRNVRNGIPVRYGTLTWTIQPTAGTPIILTASLTDSPPAGRRQLHGPDRRTDLWLFAGQSH